MPNMTLSFSMQTRQRMNAQPHIRWSAVVRSIIEQKLADFEEAERLAKKGGLTWNDVEPVVQKIRKDTRKHVRMLLHETHG